MGLAEASSVATPGLKRSFTDEVMDLVLDEEEEVNSTTMVAPLPFNTSNHKVRFAQHIEYREVHPYSSVYGSHPRTFVFDRQGRKVIIPPDCDASTGQTREVMNHRRDSIIRRPQSRAQIFRRVLRCGPAWEETTHARVAKASKKFTKKRIGAKAAK